MKFSHALSILSVFSLGGCSLLEGLLDGTLDLSDLSSMSLEDLFNLDSEALSNLDTDALKTYLIDSGYGDYINLDQFSSREDFEKLEEFFDDLEAVAETDLIDLSALEDQTIPIAGIGFATQAGDISIDSAFVDTTGSWVLSNGQITINTDRGGAEGNAVSFLTSDVYGESGKDASKGLSYTMVNPGYSPNISANIYEITDDNNEDNVVFRGIHGSVATSIPTSGTVEYEGSVDGNLTFVKEDDSLQTDGFIGYQVLAVDFGTGKADLTLNSFSGALGVTEIAYTGIDVSGSGFSGGSIDVTSSVSGADWTSLGSNLQGRFFGLYGGDSEFFSALPPVQAGGAFITRGTSGQIDGLFSGVANLDLFGLD